MPTITQPTNSRFENRKDAAAEKRWQPGLVLMGCVGASAFFWGLTALLFRAL